MNISSIPLCGILILLNGVRHVVLLLCNHFGVADSNYHFGVLSSFFLHESQARLALISPLPLSAILTDDFCIFAPLDIIVAELAAVSVDFRQYLGASAVNASKDICAQTLEMAGAFFDCINLTLRMTQKGFSTMLYYFFVIAPDSPSVNDSFPIKSFQQLGSLAIYYANFLTAALPYSRGFHAATANFSEADLDAVWTPRAIGDLFIWRILLLLSIENCTWLTVSIYRPVLMRRIHPLESDAERGFRHAAAATAVAYSDGCTTNNGFAPNGLGGYQSHPNGFWFTSDIADLPFYSSLLHTMLPTDINLIEFIALIITLRCMIFTHIHAHGTCTNCHFHIWCDNTSCLSWIRRHRALQPIHSMLLQLFTLLQVHFQIMVTVAHIPGCINIYADAPSRKFQVPNLAHIHEVLSLVPQLHILPTFSASIATLATCTSDVPLQQVQGGLMLLDVSIGMISATPML
jgi:hypothetical protein